MNTRRRVYTVPEAAEMLGVHPLTIRRAIDRGELPSLRVGRRVLIPAPAFEKFLLADAAQA